MSIRKRFIHFFCAIVMSSFLVLPFTNVNAQTYSYTEETPQPRQPVSPDTSVSSANRVTWILGGIILSIVAYYTVIYIMPSVDDD